MTKHTSEGIHPGFEIQGRRHQKSKIGVSVTPQKRLMSSKIFFLKAIVPRENSGFAPELFSMWKYRYAPWRRHWPPCRRTRRQREGWSPPSGPSHCRSHCLCWTGMICSNCALMSSPNRVWKCVETFFITNLSFHKLKICEDLFDTSKFLNIGSILFSGNHSNTSLNCRKLC